MAECSRLCTCDIHGRLVRFPQCNQAMDFSYAQSIPKDPQEVGVIPGNSAVECLWLPGKTANMRRSQACKFLCFSVRLRYFDTPSNVYFKKTLVVTERFEHHVLLNETMYIEQHSNSACGFEHSKLSCPIFYL